MVIYIFVEIIPSIFLHFLSFFLSHSHSIGAGYTNRLHIFQRRNGTWKKTELHRDVGDLDGRLADDLHVGSVRTDSGRKSDFRYSYGYGVCPDYGICSGNSGTKMAWYNGHLDQYFYRYRCPPSLHFWICIQGKYLQSTVIFSCVTLSREMIILRDLDKFSGQGDLLIVLCVINTVLSMIDIIPRITVFVKIKFTRYNGYIINLLFRFSFNLYFLFIVQAIFDELSLVCITLQLEIVLNFLFSVFFLKGQLANGGLNVRSIAPGISRTHFNGDTGESFMAT